MLDLKPWSSARDVERAIAAYGRREVSAWLSVNWSRAYLEAGPADVRPKLPLLDFPRVRDRAQTVLFAIGHDWDEVLDAADAPGCGFTPTFWREAFGCAQEAGATQCILWLLDRKAALLAGAREGLEL